MGKKPKSFVHDTRTSQEGALVKDQVKVISSEVARSQKIDRLIRHINRSEKYSFESVCNTINAAVSEAKLKRR